VASISFVEGKWRALIRRKGFKDISKRFDTKAKAAAWARDIEGQILAGAIPQVIASKETIAQLIAKYRRLRASTRPILDTTTEHYTLKQLTRSLGPIVAAAMTVDDLLGWAQQRRDEGAGPYTINCDLSKLGTVIRYAGNGLPDVIGAARPKLSYLGLIGGGGLRERRPTEDELQRVLAWLASEKGPVYADAALFASITAMRRGEVCRIAWADLDEAKKMVLIDTAGMAQREQVMPSLYFLQKQDVGCHCGDGLLDPMNARTRTDGTDAFVNIPGSDAKFHAGWRCKGGLEVDLDVGRNVGLDVRLNVSSDGCKDSAVLGQLQDGLCIGRRKTLIRGLAPGQPAVLQMLALSQLHGDIRWHHQAEDMLGIMSDALGIAMTPDRIDFIHVGKLPVPKVFCGHALTANQDAGFLLNFPNRCSQQRLIERIFGTRDRLPEAGLVRTLK
jgi:hypothetical protein